MIESIAHLPEIPEKVKKYEDEILRHLTNREESYQRSDTDGFLSQYFSGISADLARENLKIAKNKGYAQFPILCDEKGNVISSKIIRITDKYAYNQTTKPLFLVDHDYRHLYRKWIPVNQNSRVQRNFKLHQEFRWFPAIAVIRSNGKGLSGKIWIEVIKIEDV